MTKQTKVNGGASPTHVNMVGEGTVFEGTLQSEGDVRVSGRVIGKLKVNGKVSVAQEGAIEGEIFASNADISGHIEGDLFVEERLLLRSTARVMGNIHAKRLVMEEGGAFEGKCQMGQKALNPSARAEADKRAEAGNAAKTNGKDVSKEPAKATG